ncbi:MAG: hypothetical protein U0165_19125 [Polyangiaceae bacterium]
MKRALLTSTALIVVTQAMACVPSFASLVRNKRYADALCHAGTQVDAERIANAVEQDANLRLHVYAVHRAELEPVLGAKSEDIDAKLTFIRAITGTNQLPLDLHTTVKLEADAKAIEIDRGTTPSTASAALLFGLTGERLPTSYTAVDEDKLAREIGWAVFTLGLKQLLFGTEKLTYERSPDRADYLAKGPVAMSLYDGLSNGSRNTHVYVIPKTSDPSAKLTITMTATAYHEDSGICDLSIEYVADLGQPKRALTEVLDERFGNSARTIAELNPTRKIWLSNPTGRWRKPQ